MTHPTPRRRPSSERFVEDYAALDPVTATYVGIAGHDDRLPDLSPDGLRRPRGARPRGPRRPSTAATPVDEREAVARDAFVERLGLELEMADAGPPAQRVSVISSALHEHPRWSST